MGCRLHSRKPPIEKSGASYVTEQKENRSVSPLAVGPQRRSLTPIVWATMRLGVLFRAVLALVAVALNDGAVRGERWGGSGHGP